MCVLAAKRVSPEHPRAEEVTRIRELARHLRDRVEASDRLADAAEFEFRTHALLAASRTASKIFW
jgi:hypothetical protein